MTFYKKDSTLLDNKSYKKKYVRLSIEENVFILVLFDQFAFS